MARVKEIRIGKTVTCSINYNSLREEVSFSVEIQDGDKEEAVIEEFSQKINRIMVEKLNSDMKIFLE